MATSVEIKPKDSVLGLKEKLAFFSANIGNIPIMTMMSYYLLLFYTDVVGLNPVAIGTLFLIARVMDGLSDPIMGYVIDHLPRTKMGRFRSYLLIGVVVCSLNFLLVWLGPSLAISGKLVIAYISYLLLGWTFDLMDIPLNSMIPVMSDREKDRNTLSILKGAGYMLGAVAIVAGVLPLVRLFPTQKEGFHAVIIGVTAIVALFSILGTLGIQERIFPMRAEKYNFGNIKDIIGARPVLVHFLTTLLTSIGSGVSTGTLVFFFLYALKRPDLFSVTALSYVLGVSVAVLTAPALIRRFGRKTSLVFTLLLSLSGSLVMFLTPTSLPLIFIIVPMLTSPAVGMSMVLSYGIQADNMDFIEWKHSYRAEATVASMNSFIVKAAGGVGSAIGAYLLVFYHYVPNAETQAAETIRGFYSINFAIPGIFTLVALLVWIIGYPLTKKAHLQMVAELAERRTQAGIGRSTVKTD
jgi:sugar (glycoside-pentoside-hexuronide) transporter